MKFAPQMSHFVTPHTPLNPTSLRTLTPPHLPTPASQLKPLPNSSYNFTPPRPYPKTLKPKPSSPHTHYYATHLPTFYTPAFTPRTHAPNLKPYSDNRNYALTSLFKPSSPYAPFHTIHPKLPRPLHP